MTHGTSRIGVRADPRDGEGHADAAAAPMIAGPASRVDAAILRGVFQPAVDWMGFDPGRALRTLLVLHAALLAVTCAAYMVLDAAGIPAASRLEAVLGFPAYAVIETVFLWTYARFQDRLGTSPFNPLVRIAMAGSAILLAALLPRILLGTAPDALLDAAGRTPAALRQGLACYAFSRWSGAAVMYLAICRKAPPRRRTSPA